MSKYDSIKTAADLISEVIMHGLSTEQDDTNRAADIFGNSAVGELAELANSENQKISNTFYSIAFRVWHWEQATRFFNEHTNPVTKEARANAEELRKVKSELEAIKLQEKHHKELAANYSTEVHDLEVTVQEQAQTILELKAKLYDLTVAGA